MEASQYGLTRRTCLVARGFEVVTVAALMCISWCVFGAWDFVLFSFFVLRTHTACCKYEATMPHLHLQ